jgi:hypothetical protein
VLLAQLYDRHADDCARSAEHTENPARRTLLLKLANQWRHEAQQLRATEDRAVSAPDLSHSSRRTRSARTSRRRERAGQGRDG